MAHYAWFNGCTSREQAARFGQLSEQDRIASGPELESRYSFPIFWLAGFAPEDQLLIEATMKVAGDAHETYVREFLVLCASASHFTGRLRRRRTEVLRLLPPQYATFYDEWTDYIAAHFHRYVLLNTSDIFAMDDDAVCGERLIRSLQAFELADRGESITNIESINWATLLPANFMNMRKPDEDGSSAALGWRQALAGYTSYRDRDSSRRWPGPPTEGEIHAAEAVPMETIRYAEPYLESSPYVAAQPPHFINKLERLLALLTAALLGSVMVLLGVAFAWVNLLTPGKFLVVGLALSAGGTWLLRRAWKQVRR